MKASTILESPLKLVKGIQKIIWPEICILCGDRLNKDEHYLCLHCLSDLPRTEYHLKPDNRITRLALPLAPSIRSANWFYYHHDAPCHKLIHAIKYHDRPQLARYLGREFASELSADDFFANNKIDVILPIPLHWTRFVKRTYNQAEMIARGFSDITGIEVGDHLHAVRRHVSQTRGGRESRALNVEGIFGIKHSEELSGLNIAILDDVITTGATITSAARTVIEAGIKPVSLTFISLGATQLR